MTHKLFSGISPSTGSVVCSQTYGHSSRSRRQIDAYSVAAAGCRAISRCHSEPSGG
jgi:hypothetical protein